MAELNNYLIYAGINSSNHGVFLSGAGTFGAPVRRGELVAVPGRNGALFIDGGAFDNLEVRYPAFMADGDSDTFASRLGSFRSALAAQTSYSRLTDTYHPDEYRLAIFRSGLTVEPLQYNRAGNFELVFDCKPQRFLLSGDEAIAVQDGDSLENPTNFEALPLIEVVGTGSLTIGNVTVVVSGEASQVLIIDCDLMDAYINDSGSITSANDLISLNGDKFPTLQPGETGVAFTGFSSVEITPRWWTL